MKVNEIQRKTLSEEERSVSQKLLPKRLMKLQQSPLIATNEKRHTADTLRLEEWQLKRTPILGWGWQQNDKAPNYFLTSQKLW